MAAFGYKRDDFDFRENLFNPNIEIIALNSTNFKKSIEYIKENNIKGIELNPYYGCYKKDDLNVLSELFNQEIKVINLVGDFKDIEILNNFKKLEQLSISENKKSIIDFNNFSDLRELNFDWSSNFKNLDSLKKLEVLNMRNFIYNADLSFFKLSGLKELGIGSSKIENIDFIEGLKLEKLSLSYCSRLNDILGLRNIKDTITYLEIENCKKINNYNIISELHLLNWLKLSNQGKIESLSFIENLKFLENLSFVDTIIIDGNLSYCENLKYVGFENKKHYTHKYENLAPMID